MVEGFLVGVACVGAAVLASAEPISSVAEGLASGAADLRAGLGFVSEEAVMAAAAAPMSDDNSQSPPSASSSSHSGGRKLGAFDSRSVSHSTPANLTLSSQLRSWSVKQPSQ